MTHGGLVVFLVGIGANAPALAGPAESDAKASTAVALAEKVQAYYERWSDFRADFIQIYTRAALSRTREQRGTLTLKKPGKVRWAYEKPTKKLFVSDGKTLWVYEPEEQQVLVDRSFGRNDLSTSVAFLFGNAKLSERFTIAVVEAGTYGLSPELSLLELIPKKDPAYRKLVLAVDEKTGAVRETVLFLTSGDRNRLVLRNPKLNAGAPEKLFRFSPPAGVEVIERAANDG